MNLFSGGKRDSPGRFPSSLGSLGESSSGSTLVSYGVSSASLKGFTSSMTGGSNGSSSNGTGGSMSKSLFSSFSQASVSAAASAASAASSAASSASSAANTAATTISTIKLPIPTPSFSSSSSSANAIAAQIKLFETNCEAVNQMVSSLKLDTDFCHERDALFERFLNLHAAVVAASADDDEEDLLDQSSAAGGGSVSGSVHGSVASRLAKSASVLDVPRIPMESFVIDMKSLGISVQWSDAAFRALDLDLKAGLTKAQFLLAAVALRQDGPYAELPAWTELRRKVVFSFYDRTGKNMWQQADFLDFMRDASDSQDEPMKWGITNKSWRERAQQEDEDGFSSSHGSSRRMDSDAISQALAVTKIELALKKSDFEELHYTYLQLEKKYCDMKLELAAAKALIDS